MSREIIAQPGLDKVECDVILTALEWFTTAVMQPHAGGDNSAQALKKEQYMIVAAEVKGKIARDVVRMGRMPNARNIYPGSGKVPKLI